MVEKIKWLIAIAVLVLSIVGFYYFESQSMLARVGGLLGGTIVFVVLALLTEKGRAFKGFVGETRAEFRKIVWPTRRETLQTTGIVIVLVFVVAVFLWLLDTIILNVVEYLTL
ncbi:MAG: preprotein translocase subunit SecE [Gammaproteobacteria bacterium]|nr:MAG: preprotein translocase subunit SecE [Gammaproteobacteria bacterium]